MQYALYQNDNNGLSNEKDDTRIYINPFLFISGTFCPHYVQAPFSPNFLKGIVQPFELGGVTRLIQSAVKLCMAGNLKKKF